MTMNILKAIKLYILNGWIVWYTNYILIKLLPKKKKCTKMATTSNKGIVADHPKKKKKMRTALFAMVKWEVKTVTMT